MRILSLLLITTGLLKAQTPPELAEYMVDLQTLTHKLGLSVDAENLPLVKFYLHETEVKIVEIQETLPEYEGVAIAVFMERFAHPAMKQFKDTVKEQSELSEANFKHMQTAYNGLLNSCNACHVLSQRPEIKIVHNPHNPYLQSFTADE